ncbi:sporulation protein [Bacillus massilinigeriensis]|uniref:sporulation protein n=1 Tax=Bacillus massilionigeriensis TaxID=1805475 RepID=UPI00096B10DA|nr:sporulation protein [Bacillus massilionigeriensis]
MSLFNKIFASVGIGSAKVDTKLESSSVVPGELVKGAIEVRGGNIEQHIESIYLSLHTTYIKEMDDKKFTATGLIDGFRIAESFTIQPNELKEIPFSFLLPIDTPISIGRTKIWVSTGLNISNAVDPSDKDDLKIIPNPLMSAVLQAVSDLGFRLREVECEEAPYRLRGRFPFIQEFEFVPTSGPFRGRLDELEIVFFPKSANEIELLMQVDRRARGLGGFLAEALEIDETKVRVTITSADMAFMKDKMKRVVESYS